jgi:transposase
MEVLKVPLTSIERLLLAQQLSALKTLDESIDVLDAEITKIVASYKKQMGMLRKVPGVDFVAAAAILAEIGPDMSVFRGADGLAAWTGVAPGQNESAGKRKRSKTRRGNAYLSRILVQCAITISRCKKQKHDLTDFWRRKLPRLGYKKTAVAVARKLIVRIWRMFTDGVDYAPPPPRPLSEKQRVRRAKNNIARLEELGFKVTIERAAV